MELRYPPLQCTTMAAFGSISESEIRRGEGVIAEDASGRGQLLVRDLQKLFEESEFIHEMKSGRVDRVAAETAEEVLMFFENGDGDAGAGEKIAEHDAGGSSPYDATGGFEGLRLHRYMWSAE